MSDITIHGSYYGLDILLWGSTIANNPFNTIAYRY